MQLKKEIAPEFDVAWKGDQLDRKKVADYLTPVIASITQPFVISISSEYGTGKTFFIKEWHKELNHKGFKAVYFNAWETDYAEDALVAFISSIKRQLEGAKGEHSKDVIEFAKKGGLYATRKVLPVIAKGIARKVIGSETVEDFLDLSEASDDDIADLFGEVAEDSLRKHEAIEKSITAFKAYLKNFIEIITKDADHDQKKKLIIFIDELDRCRPTYTVEVLECIKHLFNAPGVVFVLAVDEKQLSSAVASVYGTQTSGEGYLRKFIDWQLKLPMPNAMKYAAYLFHSFKLEETDHFLDNGGYLNSKKILVNAFGVFAHSFGLSLREQAHCFTEINLSIRSLKRGEEVESFLTGIMPVLILKCRPELENCLIGRTNPEDFIKFIETELDVELYDKAIRDWQLDRMIFHAVFSNKHSMQSLRKEYDDINQLAKKDTSKAISEEKQKRQKYLAKVIDIYDGLRFDSSYYRTYSSIVYTRLEFASSLL